MYQHVHIVCWHVHAMFLHVCHDMSLQNNPYRSNACDPDAASSHSIPRVIPLESNFTFASGRIVTTEAERYSMLSEKHCVESVPGDPRHTCILSHRE